MDVKGIFFDLDGVIVSTDRYHYLAWKKIAGELGVPFDETVNNRLRGISRMASLEIVLEAYHGTPFFPAEKSALAERKNKFYRELLCGMTPQSVEPAVRQSLCELRRRGYRLAIGSSSKNAKTILERVALTDAFDVISDGTNITHSKPDPEVFLKAAEMLALAPESCAVVEDAFAGIDAARAAGMLSIGIGEAAGYAKADCKIGALEELLDILK